MPSRLQRGVRLATRVPGQLQPQNPMTVMHLLRVGEATEAHHFCEDICKSLVTRILHALLISIGLLLQGMTHEAQMQHPWPSRRVEPQLNSPVRPDKGSSIPKCRIALLGMSIIENKRHKQHAKTSQKYRNDKLEAIPWRQRVRNRSYDSCSASCRAVLICVRPWLVSNTHCHTCPYLSSASVWEKTFTAP